MLCEKYDYARKLGVSSVKGSSNQLLAMNIIHINYIIYYVEIIILYFIYYISILL